MDVRQWLGGRHQRWQERLGSSGAGAGEEGGRGGRRRAADQAREKVSAHLDEEEAVADPENHFVGIIIYLY
jgi:hypothetical protein